MNNKILSICIPTYNRPEELRRLLESVMPQMDERVEFVIGDDGDELVTGKVLADFPGADIIYFKNQKRLGFDANLIAVTARATGEYVWWCGDDDVIAPGAIKRVLSMLLQRYKLDFIWSNYYAFPNEKELTRNLGPSHLFRDSNEVLEKIGSPLAYMSSIIFRKELILPYLSSNNSYIIGTGFANLALVLWILSKAKANYYLHEPNIICYLSSPAAPGIEDKPTYDGFQVFAINFYDIVKSFMGKGSIKNHSLRKLITENFSHVWKGILVGKARNGGELWAPRRSASLLFSRYWSYPDYWIALPFFLMPQKLVEYCYKLFKKVAR